MKQFDTTGWSKKELKELADSIYKSLGESQDLDLEQELIGHYNRCKEAAEAAQQQLLAGETTAGAAAVLTATTGALKELARLQTDLYNADRVKALERAMINALKESQDAERILEVFKGFLG